MDARCADVKVDAMQLLTMVILDTILNMTWIVFIAMVLGCIKGSRAGAAAYDAGEGD
tara:strand:+ start:492 stop:662 length:171 start_codon:yes stop_codon:yes gene_type:complete